MFNFMRRSYQKELMDLGPTYYTQQEYSDCLYKLGIIGKIFGGNSAMASALKSLGHKPTSILDVGCGGGQSAIQLAHNNPSVRILGIDVDKQALVVAQHNKLLYEKNHGIVLHNLSFEHRAQPELHEELKSFDLVIMTLVLHHLSDSEIINFLTRAQNVARRAVIINDLQRSIVAYALYWFISPFFRNRLIRYDGLLSIRRAFTREDLIRYAQKAGIDSKRCSIYWRWAFRWIMVINCT